MGSRAEGEQGRRRCGAAGTAESSKRGRGGEGREAVASPALAEQGRLRLDGAFGEEDADDGDGRRRSGEEESSEGWQGSSVRQLRRRRGGAGGGIGSIPIWITRRTGTRRWRRRGGADDGGWRGRLRGVVWRGGLGGGIRGRARLPRSRSRRGRRGGARRGGEWVWRSRSGGVAGVMGAPAGPAWLA